MYLKTSLLLLAVITLCTSNQAYRKPTPHSLNRVNKGNNNSKDSCFCFDNPDSNSLVSQLLDPKKNGVERLVVYFYKNPNTKELKLYTPNIEKQNLIPDIAFEVGDGLTTITNETASQIFDKNPNTVVQNTNKNDDKTVNRPDTNSVGLLNGEIQIVDDVNTPSVKNDKNANTKIPRVISHTNPKPYVVGVKEPSNHNEEISPESDNANYLINNLHSKENWAVPTQKSQKWREYITNHYYPRLLNYQDNNKINGKSYITFDKWFGQQIENFQQLESHGSIRSIDVDMLKTLVMKTLQENDIYSTSEGFLRDSQGTVLDMSNLKLRPVLIGDSITYDNFLQFTSGGYTSPRDFPYLETVLVTLVYPPKILGIIPLGKTFLPPVPSSASRPNTFIPHIHTKFKTVNKPYCNNGLCYSQKVVEPTSLHSHTGSSDRKVIIPDITNHQKIRHEYNSGDPAKSYVNTNIKQSDYKEDESYLKRPMHLKKPTLSIDALIRTLINLLSDRSKKDAASNRRANVKPMFDEVLNKGEPVFGAEDYDEEDEIPDFRIIGGAPATSSGTPVNSKGRSGGIA